MSDDAAACPQCGWTDRGKLGVIYLSTPAEVAQRFAVSQNAFKRALKSIVVVGGAQVAERPPTTDFSIHMRHPSENDAYWTATLEGPNGVFDLGVAESPDEALLQIVDSIALYDYDDRYSADPDEFD